jgi:hypothetical protein
LKDTQGGPAFADFSLKILLDYWRLWNRAHLFTF